MNNFFSIWIDVSKSFLDIYNNQSLSYSKISNSYDSIFNFLSSIQFKENFIVFYEATWVYSSHLIKCLNDLWFSHYQFHPNTIHFLSLWFSDRNKSDKIDCYKICSIWISLFDIYNKKKSSFKLTIPNSNIINQLNSLLSNIHSLKNNIKIFKQNIDCIKNNCFAKKNLIEFYKNQIEQFESQINSIILDIKLILKDEWLLIKFENLLTIPTVWEILGIELTIFFVNLSAKWLTSQDKSKLKAYVWIDPIEKQSWTTLNRVQISKKWNKKIRSSLYFISISWFRLIEIDKYKNTNMWQFFLRMRSKFKDRKKSTITAMSKKILLIAWWIFWNDKPFDYSYNF